MRRLALVMLMATAASLAGCASKKVEERGWIGGTTTTAMGLEEGVLFSSTSEVVTHVPTHSPAAAAGLQPSDVVMAIDGESVDSPTEYRELIEARRPGETVHLSVWRCGRRLCLPVTVGCEQLCRQHSVMFGAGLSPGTIDLWPFDNGVNVLGLVEASHRSTRRDLEHPVTEYRCCQLETPEARRWASPAQEVTRVGCAPLYLSTSKHVVSQRAVRPGAPAE